jgi:hypothetical protein
MTFLCYCLLHSARYTYYYSSNAHGQDSCEIGAKISVLLTPLVQWLI